MVPRCRCMDKKYIPVCIYPYMGQIQLAMDNENAYTKPVYDSRCET